MKKVDRQAVGDQSRTRATRSQTRTPQASGDEGFMLLALIVAIALILLALSVAAADIAFTLRREREVESVHRANQYIRAIQLFYKKFGNYPGSLEALEKSNNIRFLRQQYIDPLTGKSDWRLIGVGANKTTVKGFFGEDLTGIATTGLGSASGMQSGGTGGGSSTTSGTNSATDASGAASASGSSGFGFGNSSGSDSSSSASTSSGLGSIDGMKSKGMGSSSGPIMGVGSSATGNSIIVVNEQKTYETWEFLYDPRIEQLKLKAQLMNGSSDSLGSVSSQSTGSLNGTTTTPAKDPTASSGF